MKRYTVSGGSGGFNVLTPDGNALCMVSWHLPEARESARADAEHIAHALNVYGVATGDFEDIARTIRYTDLSSLLWDVGALDRAGAIRERYARELAAAMQRVSKNGSFDSEHFVRACVGEL